MTLDNYEPVAQRLDRWLESTDGQTAVITEMLSIPGADVCVIKATLIVEGIVIATGHAEEVRGNGNVNRTSHVENCETSAIGRALANAGFAGSDWTKRPSREEMQKVQRYEQAAPARSGGRANKFAGKCMRCFTQVGENQGIAVQEDGRWKTYHLDGQCPPNDEEEAF